MRRLTKKKLLRYVILPNVCLFTALAFYFPGQQLPIALSEGHTLPDAARFAAALAVTKVGAQTSIPSRQAIEKLPGC